MNEDIEHLDFEPEDPELREGLNSMGNPKERDDSEPEPEYSEYDALHFEEALRNKNKEEIFSAEELATAEENEASEESTQALVNSIQALCKEKAPGQQDYHFEHGRKLQRRLSSRDEKRHLIRELHLNYYPEGADHSVAEGFHNVDRSASVDLEHLHSGKREFTIPGFEGTAGYYDDLFVDTRTGKAMIKRSVERNRFNSPSYHPSATRVATETEVQEALNLITQMVQEEDKFRSAQAESPAA